MVAYLKGVTENRWKNDVNRNYHNMNTERSGNAAGRACAEHIRIIIEEPIISLSGGDARA
jgi:hypothetical protein